MSEGQLPLEPDAFSRGASIARWGTVMIAVLFGAAVLWLTLAPLDGAVVVPAQVKVENYRKTVQHLEGGIVKEVLVREGDRVRAGQTLLQFEEVQADAAVESLRDQQDAEMARRARADAERLQRSKPEFPQDLIVRAQESDKLRSLLAAEQELFGARRKQLEGHTRLLRNQIKQVGAELNALRSQAASADVNRKLLADELAINVDLQRQQFVQKTRVMAVERALAQQDERRGEYAAESAKAQQKLIELDLKVMGLQDEHVKRATDEFSEANRRVLELQERLRPVAHLLSRQIVVAPSDGEVVGLRVHARGNVAAPRDVLMEIVPDQPKLVLEGKIRPEDVAQVSSGQAVEIQITAFKQRSVPLLAGRLSHVSADSLTEMVNGVAVPYYLAQVTVEEAGTAVSLPAPLAPGMPAIVFIRTRARSALDYLLQPVTDSFKKAFREH